MSLQEMFFLSTMVFPQLPTNESRSKLRSDYISFTAHSATHYTIIIWTLQQILLRPANWGRLDRRNAQL